MWATVGAGEVNEQDIAALNQAAIDRNDAEDPAVFAAILDLMAERRQRADKIHERLIQDPQFETVSLEAVKLIIGSMAFLQAFAEVAADPGEYCKKRVRKNLPKMLGGVERLAADSNEDKRTRTSNLQWYLGVGGLSPTQKVEMGEDLMSVFEKIVAPSLKKKDAPDGETGTP
jgi:hypothetical protein